MTEQMATFSFPVIAELLDELDSAYRQFPLVVHHAYPAAREARIQELRAQILGLFAAPNYSKGQSE